MPPWLPYFGAVAALVLLAAAISAVVGRECDRVVRSEEEDQIR